MTRDIRYAFRLMRRTPVFTIAVVFTIALGIGAVTAIFSVVDAVLIRPLPFADPERLYQVAERNDRLQLPVFAASVLNFIAWREQVDRFEELGAVGAGSYALSGRGEPEQFGGFRISPAVIRILGLHALIGRAFADDEERPSAEPVAMIGEELWRHRFGADPSIIGQTVILNGIPTTVVGIAPSQLSVLTGGGDIWTPLTINTATEQRLNHLITVIGRVKPGVTEREAQLEMDTIVARVRQQYPELRDWGVRLVTFRDMFVSKPLQTALLVSFAAVGLVLLIACTNITNLLLIRATGRERELAIRIGIGAERSRVLRQMLMESVVLAAVGGVVGLSVAVAAVRAINRALPPNVLPVPAVTIDATVVAFAAGITMVCGVLFGVLPAHRATRTDVNAILKQSGRSGTSSGHTGLRNALASAELALATLLLIAAGLLVETLFQLQRVRLGFRTDGILTFQIAPPPARYGLDQSMLLYRRMLAALRELPGVQGAAMSSGIPLGSGAGTRTPTTGLHPSAVPPDTAVPINWRVVSPGFFQTMGMRIVEGRDFDERDDRNAPATAVVSEATARMFWGKDDPIGRTVRIVATSRDFTIIGVVNDVRLTTPGDDSPAMYFSSYARTWPTMDVVVHTSRSPDLVLLDVRRKIREVDPGLPLSHVRTMEEWAAGSVVQPRLNALVIAIFASGALLLAAIGVYGVLAYSVAQRTYEIALRMALGAQRGAVLGLILREGLTIGTTGVALGIGAAMIAGRALTTLVFGINVRDPAIFVVVSVLLLAVTAGASAIPARRASRVDPMRALRES